MISLALIRHGPTVWNEQKRLQGQTDIPLSPDGRKRVEGRRVPDEFSDFNWFASPLSRAQQNAELLVRDRVGEWVSRVAKTGVHTGAVAHQGIIRAMVSLATGWDMINPPPEKMEWDAVQLFALDANGDVKIDRYNISLIADDT